MPMVSLKLVCPGSPRVFLPVGMPAEEGDERVAILADEDSRAQLQLTATCIWGRLLRRAVSWLLVAMVVVLLLPVWWPVSFPWWLPIHGAPEWPGTVEQWRAARADIDLKHTDVGAFQLEEAALPAYLSNFHPAGLLRLLPPSLIRLAFNFGGWLQIDSRDCVAHFRGVRVEYVQVYRSANRGICKNLQRHVEDGSGSKGTRGRVTFTFVREPLQHFASGYSEICNRARNASAGLRCVLDPQCHPMYVWRRDLYTFLDFAPDSEERPFAFLRDLLAGRLHRVPYLRDSTDLHVWPQVAWISRLFDVPHTRSRHPELHWVGRLESLAADWDALGAIVSAAAAAAAISPVSSPSTAREGRPKAVEAPPARWPAHDSSLWEEHHPADVAAARRAMERLLNVTVPGAKDEDADAARSAARRTRYLCALVRVLLPDFVCFNYTLPPTCTPLITRSHSVPCMLRVRLPPPLYSL